MRSTLPLLVGLASAQQCSDIKSAYQDLQCCPGSAPTPQKDICYLDKVHFPAAKGAEANYFYGVAGLSADAKIVYAYSNSDVANIVGSVGLQTPHATLVRDDRDIYRLLRKNPSDVQDADVRLLLENGGVIAANHGQGWATQQDALTYKMKVPTAEEPLWDSKNAWYDPMKGTVSIYYFCDEIDTVLPEYTGNSPKVKLGQPMAEEPASFAAIPQLAAVSDFKVVYKPSGSAYDTIALDTAYSLDDLLAKTGKTKVYYMQHACWCPSCVSALYGGYGFFPMGGSGHRDMHDFLTEQNLRDDILELVVFIDEPFLDGQERVHNRTFDPPNDDTMPFITNVFKTYYGMDDAIAQQFGFMAATSSREVCQPIGYEFDPDGYFWKNSIGENITVNGQNYSHVMTLDWFTSQLPNALFVKGEGYGSKGCPEGCNSKVNVLDGATQKVLKSTNALHAASNDWLTYLPSMPNLFDDLGISAAFHNFTGVPTYPAVPPYAYTPIDKLGLPAALRNVCETSTALV